MQRGAPPILVIFFVAVGALAAARRADDRRPAGACRRRRCRHRGDPARVSTSGLRVSGVDPRPQARYVWTGLISQAGITLGFASIVAAEFPGWGTQLQTLLVALIAHPRARRADRLPTRPRARGRSRPQRAAVRCSWCRTASRTCIAGTATARITATPATGGVRGGARCADARAGRRLDRARRGRRRTARSSMRPDKVMVPPDSPSYELRRLWLEEPTFSAYYGGFANEGLWPLCHVVDVRPQFRSEDWAAYQAVNVRFAAAIDDELASSPGRRSSSRTTTSRSSRRRCGRAVPMRARRCSGTFRGHIPIGCASARGGARSWPGCWPTTCWRSSSNATAATSCWRWKRSSDAEIEDEASRVASTVGTSTVVSVPIGVDYDRIQAIASDAGARARNSGGSCGCSACTADIIGHRRRSARLHQGHSRAPRGARRVC